MKSRKSPSSDLDADKVLAALHANPGRGVPELRAAIARVKAEAARERLLREGLTENDVSDAVSWAREERR